MRPFLVTAILLACTDGFTQLNVSAAQPPAAKKIDHWREMHGEKFNDTYFWLRDKANPEVINHLKAENSYAEAVMATAKPLEDKLYAEMLARIQETDLQVPVFRNGYWYYSRTVKGSQYSIQARRKGTMKAKEEILIDENELAKDKPYFSLSAIDVSPNNRLMATMIDITGYRVYRLAIKDLATGKYLKDPKSQSEDWGQINGFEWANDNRTFFYRTENAAKRPDKLWRANLQGQREMLLEEKSGQYNLYSSATRDRKYLLIGSQSQETSELRVIPLDKPNLRPRTIWQKREGIEAYAEHRDGFFFIRTNDQAKEYRIIKAPANDLDRSKWVTVVPTEKTGSIQGMEVFQDWLVVSIRKNAVVQRRVTNLKNGKQYAIQFPETYYAVFPGDNPTFNSNKLRLTYSSPVTPTTVYDYDLSKRSFIRLKRQVVKGYDRSQYETKLVWVSARDGARIPVSLTYRKGRAKQGPMLLDAYGAYGAPSFPFFSSNDVSLWNRGMATGIAAIRGGGDMGDAWHEQGKMARKINTFTDFIDCAQALVSMGYTKHDRLAITGGSAGGLTMGAVMNLRPSVARVALVYVPFVDVINTMLDESLPLTTQEFLEWGNPKNSIHYWWLRQYSPYENIGHYDYPAVLVRTSLNDSQVPYWEAAKWVARLRDRRADKDPLLLKTNLDAGHGGSSGRYDALRDSAHDYAFMLNVLGIRD